MPIIALVCSNQIQIQTSKQYTFQTNFRYTGRNENAQTITKITFRSGLNKPLFNNKVALTFNIRNVLNSRQEQILRTGEGFSYESNRKLLGPKYSLPLSTGSTKKKIQKQDNQEGVIVKVLIYQ